MRITKLNREIILTTIRRHLRERHRESEDVRPLGEVVAQVAAEIRAGSNGRSRATDPDVIPIEKVAAFVDGNVEPSEENLICDAMMVDNSVLAEVVAAIEAKRVPMEKLPPLPAALAERLLAMKSPAASDANTADDNRAHDSDSHSVPSEIIVQTHRVDTSDDRDARFQRQVKLAIGLCALAATIVFGIILLGRNRAEQPDPSSLVNNADVVSPSPTPPNLGPDLAVPPESQSPPPSELNRIADNEPPAPPASLDSQSDDVPELDPIVVPLPEESVVDSSDEGTDLPPEELHPQFDSAPVKKIAARGMTDLRWTEISGLLAQMNEAPSPSGSGRAPTWSRVTEGARGKPNQTPMERLTLRTLPFSRAQGELSKGGRIVLASDTGVQIVQGDDEASADLDLMYGSIAMVNLPRGTTVRLRQGNRDFATLRWQRGASVIVHRQAAGLRLQIDGGQIEIDDRPTDEGALYIANDRSLESVPAPKRLPRWISRPEETTGVDRMILAQIADTTDLTATLDRQLHTLWTSQQLSAEEQLAMVRLAHWQAAMNGANLYRLVGSRIPVLRLAALQRLVTITESDPRYSRIWNVTGRSLNNPQRLAEIRGWFLLLRSGAKPNATQLSQMLSGLSSPSIAGRALSDYVLRQYVRNPPDFDPTWTGQRQQQAVNLYRQRAAVLNDRRFSPNASAVGN